MKDLVRWENGMPMICEECGLMPAGDQYHAWCNECGERIERELIERLPDEAFQEPEEGREPV